MRESAEEAVVGKSARIVEEVTIGKQVNERQENIGDTVRHAEVDVERLGATNAQDGDSYYRSHFQATCGSTGDAYDDYAPACLDQDGARVAPFSWPGAACGRARRGDSRPCRPCRGSRARARPGLG